MEEPQLDHIEFDLQRLWILLWQKWWLLLITSIIAALVASYLDAQRADTYSAQTAIMVMRSPRGNNYDPYYDPYYDSLADQRLADSYEELIISEPVVTRASDIVGEPISAGSISIDRGEDSQILRLTVSGPNPQLAADVANGIVTAFIDFNETLLNSRYDDSAETLTIQIDQVEEQIRTVEADLSNLVTQSLTEQQVQLELLIADARDTLIEIQNDIDELENDGQSRATNTNLAGLYIDKDIWQSSLSAYVQMYQSLTSRGEGQFGDNLQIQIEQLQTNRHTLQDIYANLVSSREAIRLAKLEAAPSIVQIESASVPLFPNSRRPIALIAAAVGLFGSALLIFALELLNDTIRSPDEAERVLQLPTLGLIPETVGLMDNRSLPFIYKEPRSPISEAFRKIRTKLEYSGVDGDLRVVLTTSSDTNEGKSSLSVNLATALAQSGKKVLLLDCDLRKPTLHKYFNMSRTNGITDYLRSSDDTPSDDMIMSTAQENLYLLTSGPQPPNPAELLNSQRFHHLLKYLRAQMDYIVVDAPPLLVADPMILANLVDGVIFAVHVGKTKRRLVQSNIEELRSVGTKLLGTVLTRADKRILQYSSGYYYYADRYYQEEGETISLKHDRRHWGFGRKQTAKNPPASTSAD